jgi:UDP-N-acetylmuramyl tripeptide synthase
MEEVPNNQGFKIIVDYGCEPESFKASLEASAQLPHGRLIHVFGSTGGHRDKSKRFEFGKTSTQYSDYIIVTNDDVYESDPGEIAGNIELGIKNYELRKPAHEIILDRREAIHRALTIAQTNDLILITGKGSEQFLVLPGNKRIEWDEVSVVREELKRIEQNLKN